MIYPEKYTEEKRFLPLGFYIASSILSKNNFEVICLDLSFYKDYRTAIIQHLNENKPDVLGFSICGAKNYKYAIEIIKDMALDVLYPIIFGGQHMQPPTELDSQLYTTSFGDLEINGFFINRKIYCSSLESIDYSIVPFITEYYPSLEVSRGCWNQCVFCNSNSHHLEKSVQSIEQDLYKLAELYPRGTVVTLAGSNHLIKKWKQTGLWNVLSIFGNYFKFNFNLGIESGWEDEWDNILKLNPWNIFVGVESCNADTIIRMKKSFNPVRYINKANDFLERCKIDGVYIFASYIYGFPGDTEIELNELDNFFIKHASNNILQVGFPCEAYPGTQLLLKRKFYENQGIVYNKVYPYENIEYYHLDLSKALTYNNLSLRVKKIESLVNPQDKYSVYRCKGKII